MNVLAAWQLGAREVMVIAMILMALWLGITGRSYAKEEEVRADLQRLRTLILWLTVAGIIFIMFSVFRHYPSARVSMW